MDSEEKDIAEVHIFSEGVSRHRGVADNDVPGKHDGASVDREHTDGSDILSTLPPDDIQHHSEHTSDQPKGSEMTESIEQPSTGSEMAESAVTEQPSTGSEMTESTEQPSTGSEMTESTEQPSTGSKMAESAVTEQPSTGSEMTENTEQPSTGSEMTESTELPSTGSEMAESTEQPSTGSEMAESTEQPSTGSEIAESTKQPSTGSEIAESTEQPSTCASLKTGGSRPAPTHEATEEENALQSSLFAAVDTGNLDDLRRVLENTTGVSLQHPNKQGETVLHLAANGGHLESIKFFQDRDIDFNATDKLGDTAVHWAARQGHLDVVQYLLEQEVSVDAQNNAGETGLHVATRYGYENIVHFLCEAGANVNLTDKLGDTALHIAAWHGLSLPVCLLICSKLKDVNLKNKEGETALHSAAARGSTGCIRALVEYSADINMTNKKGCTALHLACRRHHVGVAMMLLQAGCELDPSDQIDETALHPASKEGLLSVVQAMCAYGCTVDVINKAGLTPLQLASRAGHIEVVRCLLLSGADPYCADNDGTTPEIAAMAQGHNDIAELLVKLKPGRREESISQLMPTHHPLPRIKLKIVGSSQVGKSTLIESLKCGYFGSFFRKTRLTSSAPAARDVENSPPVHSQLSTQLMFQAPHAGYTRGINVQQVNLSVAGDLSVWEFSGYEPYFMMYDHFIGDPNCVHLVVFKLEDSQDEQLAQVLFWLNFLKARMAPLEPIGTGGRQPWPAKVILVATHADKVGCSRNEDGEYVSAEVDTLLATVQHKFQPDFDITNHVFIVDGHLAMATDMKALRIQLSILKSQIVQRLPYTNGFLETAVAALPEWRKILSSCPVVSWSSFIDYIRARVNSLASEGHLKELMCQLQLVGEVVYVEAEDERDLVVLNPKWLCTDILGHLLSHDNIVHSRPTGCFTQDDIHIMFPESEASELLHLLEALEACTGCDVDGDTEYEFPCLNFIETLSGLWEASEDEKSGDVVYGGLRLQCPRGMDYQLMHLFPRIQAQLRRDFWKETEKAERDLYQWYHGSKLCLGALEGIVTLELHEQVLEIKCRGPQDSRRDIHKFMQSLTGTVESCLEDSCPGIALEKHLLSLSSPRNSSSTSSYSPKDIVLAQLQCRSEALDQNNKNEILDDLLCFGSDEVRQSLRLGVDLHVSHLSLHARRQLAMFLDQADPLGKDWVVLAVSLGLTPELPKLDSESGPAFSSTDWTLATWSQKREATIGLLLHKLQELGRQDALDALLTCSPLCYFLMKEEDGKPTKTSDENL